MEHTFDYTVTLFSPSAQVVPCLLWLLLTSHSSLLLRLMRPPVRPHGISRQSFLVYLPDLRLRVTVAFWTLMPVAISSAQYALISGFCPSSHGFAIASSRLYLTIQTLQVTLRFVGNYAPQDFHLRFGTCPSYNKKTVNQGSRFFFGAPPGTRTLGPLIKSQLLYNLS